jgi:hypothetical protein
VNKTYQRIVTDKSTWFGHAVCGEENAHVGIGKEVYFLSAEGLLMPAIKNQPAPDLRYLSNTTDKIAEHRSRLRACCAPARTSGFGERRNRPLPPTVRCSTDSGHIGAPPRTGASGPACVKGHVSRKSAESFSLFVFSRRQLLALFVFNRRN